MTGIMIIVNGILSTMADMMAETARDHETIFMVNHGMLAVGVSMRQAYFRCVVVEDAAKSLVAAAAVGKPKYLTPQEIAEFHALEVPRHREKMMAKKS